MFLLARLVLDVFGLCVNNEDLEEELRSDMLPKGYDEAYAAIYSVLSDLTKLTIVDSRYSRILFRIKEKESQSRRPRARPVLEILSCARRTLSIHELQGMLSIRIDDSSIDFKNRRYLQHFKELCGPLIEINSDETIQLVHVTTKR